jgi:hypothetical protein
MKIRSLLYLTFIVLIFNSCNNDLDILADYRETMVVYGLLNPSQTTNYVRVEKAYLGPGNALVMAQKQDSIYYDTTDLAVSIIYRKSNLTLDTFKLSPSYDIVKQEGLFTDQGHLLYKLDNKRLDILGQYQLLIQNLRTGKVVTSTTKIIEPIVQLTLFPSTKINIADNDPYHVRFYSAKNAKVYGLIFRFKYIEISNGSQDTNRYSIDFPVSDLVGGTNSNTPVALEFLLQGSDIYQFISSKIKVDPTVFRPAQLVRTDFIFTTGTDDLYNYIQVNQPSNTVNYIPDYTNLSSGKGIFSCRMDTTISNLRLNDASIDSLVNGQYTKDLF